MDVATKIRLLREATRGADDVFALRNPEGWEPVHIPLSDQNLIMHMTGDMEVGSYASIPARGGHTLCWWVGADFDGKKPGSVWQRDVERAVSFLSTTGAALLVNLSRSANGAHVRVLFKEPVPAWMARRWMQAWLDEAQCTGKDRFDEIPTSFDILCPRQDNLKPGLDRKPGRDPKNCKRYIGNLFGNPCNGRHAKRCGGSLPIDVEAAGNGHFEPDGVVIDADHFEPNGKHWLHMEKALASRSWTAADLRAALEEAPGVEIVEEPDLPTSEPRPLTVIQVGGAVAFTARFCEFMRHMRAGGKQDYYQWVALAAQLHHFGDDGEEMFHEISSLDPTYTQAGAAEKWTETAGMNPVRCDTLVGMGFRCPHLDDNRCAGAASPAYFYEHAEFEPL